MNVFLYLFKNQFFNTCSHYFRVEKIFEKIVIKGSEVIELHIYDDVFRGENWNLGKKKAVSSTYGLNGGSNKT